MSIVHAERTLHCARSHCPPLSHANSPQLSAPLKSALVKLGLSRSYFKVSQEEHTRRATTLKYSRLVCTFFPRISFISAIKPASGKYGG